MQKTDSVNYNFSKSTFPVNQKLQQYAKHVKAEDALFECTILAGKILGVRCNDTEGKGYVQITPDQWAAKTEKESKEFAAFNDYFYKNYGTGKGKCQFSNEYEAFYNVVKAWKIWSEVLTEEEKKKYFPRNS